MATIPEEYHDLFEKRSFLSFGTLSPDGKPHVTPVWVDYDGEHVLVNTARGRRKEQNLQQDERVGVASSTRTTPTGTSASRGQLRR